MAAGKLHFKSDAGGITSVSREAELEGTALENIDWCVL